jgi:hypothetical protein
MPISPVIEIYVLGCCTCQAGANDGPNRHHSKNVECTMRLPLVFLLVLAPTVAYPQPCSCGPDYCQGDPRYPSRLANKKASLAANYPAELISLLDRDSACVARVDQAPDGFSLMTVAADGSKLTVAWDADNERIAKEQIIDGRAHAYYKFNVARRFACCNEPNHDARPDWDSTLGINKGLAFACTKSGATVICQ